MLVEHLRQLHAKEQMLQKRADEVHQEMRVIEAETAGLYKARSELNQQLWKLAGGV